MKDYGLTFPDYIQSVSLTQNALGNSAEIITSGKAMGMDVQMAYSSDEKTGTFSADVTTGQFSGTTLTTTLSKTYSFDGKNPTGATLVHAELKLHYGLFSLASLARDESIKFGLEQAIDKIGDRAKVLQQNSGTSQLVTTPSQSTTPQTPTNTLVTTQPSTTANNPTPTPTPKPTPPVSQPIKPNPIPTPVQSPKPPTIILYSAIPNGMSVTIYGNAQSGLGKTLSKISLNWGDGQSSIGQFPQTHTYSQSGSYTITAMVMDSGLSSSVTTRVVISTPSPQQSNPSSQIPQQTQSTVQPSNVSIVNTSYKVSPRTYISIPFSLSCSASITGAFSAHALLGNNIDLYVFDQDNFQKYQNNNANTYLYYNEQTGSGTFTLNLTQGNYYIILSNMYSTFSTKTVNIDALYNCN